jgi:GNAT superfamily N-acetyltransferase
MVKLIERGCHTFNKTSRNVAVKPAMTHRDQRERTFLLDMVRCIPWLTRQLPSATSECMKICGFNWSEQIKDEAGCICGRLSGRRFDSESDAQERKPVMASLAEAIPAPRKWPLVVLDDIEIEKGRRSGGIGTRALRTVIESATSGGDAVILLRVGGFDGSTKEGWTRAKRLDAWYRREGFIPLLETGLERAEAEPLWAVENPAWCWYWRPCGTANAG